MTKLLKYLKKYWVLIVLCIGCVFLQSQAELALPDYMSDIVSSGIQAGGFNQAVSDILSEETYNHLLLFVPSDKQNLMQDSYTKKDVKEIDQSMQEKFPKATGNVYVLNDDVDEDQLNDLLVKPMLLVMQIDTMSPDSEQYQKMMGQMPANMTIYDVLSLMDDQSKAAMFSDIDSKMETMGESTIKIAAGNGVKAEYIKLGADVDQVQNDYIFKAGLIMLMIALAGSVAAIGGALISARVGSGVARDLRSAVFSKVESFSNGEMNKFSTASLITRSTNDITQVQMVVIMCLRIVCFAPMMGFGALYKAITNSPSMTWIIGLVLVLLLAIIIITFAIALPKFKVIQSLIDKLNLSMRENLSGLLVIRAFGNEKEAERRFDDSNINLTKVNRFVNRTMASIMPLMFFIMNAVTLLIVYFGAQQIDLGNLAIGQMMAFLQYGMHIIMSFLMIAMIAIMLPRASVSGKRIHEVLSTEPQIVDPLTPVSFDETQKGVIEFEHVYFQYPGAQTPVLSDMHFKCLPGQTTALIGSTGSGKSTLINLIPRFYEATSGTVKVDGVNIKDVLQHDLREKIGIVPQKGLLFSGTIRSNLTYGAPDATDEQLEEIIKVSQAKEFIDQKEERFDSVISQGGTNVSGGQKQRLAIARALAKNPEILIFDDSFSALDFKTDAALRKELNGMCEKYHNTVLIVGQRIASIMHADQIIVLDEGKIVGKGTHDELMKDCLVYQEIAYSQLSKEELENGKE